MSVSATAVNSFGSAVAPQFGDGLTVVRTRGLFTAMLTLATAAGDGFVGAIGIGIATFDALAIGVTALPAPIAQADWDGWLYWSPISVLNPIASSTQLISGVATQRLTIDSKAMRKFTANMVIYAVVETIEIGTATMSMSFDTRMLVKLP